MIFGAGWVPGVWRRVAGVAVVSAVTVLGLLAAPTFAATPEAPETVSPAAAVTATSATLEGVLNPLVAGEPGSYQFSYAPSEAGECVPGTLDPESPALATGGMAEHESVHLTGLEPDREYAFCIIAYSLSAEASQGNAVSFKTLTAKPTVAGESVAVTASTVAFEAQVNPNNQETTYLFEYGTSSSLTGATKLAGAGPLSGYGDQAASAPQVTGLAAGTSYYYRVVAKNATGTTDGTITKIATVAAPHTEAVTGATATTATLHGKLTPLNATVSSEYSFEYNLGTEPACTNEHATSPASAGTGSGSKAVSASVSELQPSATYSVCLVSSNAFGSEVDGTPVTFNTTAAPPELTGEIASGVSPYEATLEAQINPNNEETSYSVEYGTDPGLAGATTLPGAAPLSGYGQQTASISTGHALTPGTTYHYRVIAENAAQEETEGPVEEFTTPALTAPVVAGESSSGLTSEAATLEASINPDSQETTCEFEYAASEAAIGTPGATVVLCPSSLGNGFGEVGASVTLSGLTAKTVYYYRVLATNTTGTEHGNTETFETQTAAAPMIVSESVSTIEATAATLEAHINPENAATSYHFEYVTEAQFNANGETFTGATSTISVPIGSDETSHTVSNRVTGLTPATSYRYRVVADNQLSPAGGTTGPTKALTTPPPGGSEPAQGCKNEKLREEQPYGLALPDCRAYEMVSPTNTNGQDATSFLPESVARASEPETEGEAEKQEPAITYSAKGAYANPQGALTENQYLSRRTPGGWTTQAITPLSSTGSKQGARELSEDAYPTNYFAPELTAGIAITSAELGEAPPLGNEDYGVYVAQFPGSAYQYVGNTSALERPWGASRELNRVLLTNPETHALIEAENGTDVPVSVTNTGEAMVASAGSAESGSSSVFATKKDVWHSTSEDGSRVYFTAPPYTEVGIGQLFVRVNIGESQSAIGGKGECLEPEEACTIEVSASDRTPEDPAGAKAARYWGASAGGEKVFFTSNSELTQHAYTGPEDEAANLYEYDLKTGVLKDLTGEETDATGEGAAVQGVVQISHAGSYVYFVAKGALAAGASEQQCREETEAEKTGAEPKEENLGCNMYVSHEGGAPVFIATLNAKDRTDWSNGAEPAQEAGPEINTAVVTPSGSRLAFISERGLTSYDNQQAQAGECETELESHEDETGMCREIYVYEVETGRITCASCDPTGARPIGPSSIPGVVPRSQSSADYRPRDFLESGTLFFESKDALVPHASSGRRNVYEYESGTVHAISHAPGGYESFFLDASPDGHNVFFASADRLLPEDPGGNTVVWDARVEGGLPITAPATSCSSGETCQPPAVAPSIVGSPASATFSGPGNVLSSVVAPVAPVVKPKPETRAQKLAKALKACRKDKVRKKRVACEKTARKRYGTKKKAKNASSERRPSR